MIDVILHASFNFILLMTHQMNHLEKYQKQHIKTRTLHCILARICNSLECCALIFTQGIHTIQIMAVFLGQVQGQVFSFIGAVLQYGKKIARAPLIFSQHPCSRLSQMSQQVT